MLTLSTIGNREGLFGVGDIDVYLVLAAAGYQMAANEAWFLQGHPPAAIDARVLDDLGDRFQAGVGLCLGRRVDDVFHGIVTPARGEQEAREQDNAK
jgi:hypothetical protein